MGIKVTVVGGGSTYTPELVDGLGRRAAGPAGGGEALLPLDELVLQDVDRERLDVIGGFAGRILRRLGFAGRLTLTTDLDAALDNAAFVLVQLRVGGMHARLRDETIPPKYGLLGQETTGPGGFAKALRTVPVVLDIAERAAKRAAPGVWLLDFTNPAGLVTQALLDHGHRAIGLCNVPIGFQRFVARRLGIEPERVQLEHVGLNHLSWERKVLVDGEDRLPDLLADDGEVAALAREAGFPVDLLRLLGAVPSGYLRYYYFPRETVEAQRNGTPRAEQVLGLERRLLALYGDPAADEKPRELEQRGGAFYSEAALQLMESLHHGRDDVQVVNVRNGSPSPVAAPGLALEDRPTLAVPGLAQDDVVEVACRIDREGAHPLPVAPLAPEMLGLVQHAKAYERLTGEAAVAGDRGLALKALLTNPLVRDYDLATRLLEEILATDRDLLPRFSTR